MYSWAIILEYVIPIFKLWENSMINQILGLGTFQMDKEYQLKKSLWILTYMVVCFEQKNSGEN